MKKRLQLQENQSVQPKTENRYACLTVESLGVLELHSPLFGGGESSSPPKKKRKTRGTGQGIGRRKKSSRSISTESKVEDRPRQQPEKSRLEEVAGPSTTKHRSDKRSEWKNSPKGKESIAKSREKYESSEKALLTRRRYKSSQERLETNQRYDASQGGIQRKSRYDASQEGAERKAKYDASQQGADRKARYDASQQGADRKERYEFSPGGKETRRRYESADGRLVRTEYSQSVGGISARRKALKNYKDSEIGREMQKKARKRYELKESAKQRKKRYNAMRAYNGRVKKAIQHLAKRAAEFRPSNTESQHDILDEQFDEQPELKDPSQNEPGVEESASNKSAMSAIRSYKVS